MARTLRLIQDGDTNIPWHEVDFEHLYDRAPTHVLLSGEISLIRTAQLKLQFLWHYGVWKHGLDCDERYDEETIRLVHERQDVEFWKDLEKKRRDWEWESENNREKAKREAAEKNAPGYAARQAGITLPEES